MWKNAPYQIQLCHFSPISFHFCFHSTTENVSLTECREIHTPYVMFDIEEYSEYRARCNAWCSYYSLSCFNENQIKFMFLLLGNLLRLYLHFPFPLLPFLIHSNHILLFTFAVFFLVIVTTEVFFFKSNICCVKLSLGLYFFCQYVAI